MFLFDVMPITPIQILWVNMITAVTLALAFEPAEEGILRRPPARPALACCPGAGKELQASFKTERPRY